MNNETTDRKKQALQRATDAFWAQIAAAYPEAVDGHLDPLNAIHFDHATEEVVDAWIELNVPQEDAGSDGEDDGLPGILARLERAGYQTQETGGGCMSYHVTKAARVGLIDILVTSMDDPALLPSDEDDGVMVGLYDYNGDMLALVNRVSVEDAVSFPELLAVADALHDAGMWDQIFETLPEAQGAI